MALFIPLTHGEYFEEEVERKIEFAFGTGRGKLSIVAKSLGEYNKIGFKDKNPQEVVR